MRELMVQASSLLGRLHEHAGSRDEARADDILLLLYRVRDRYRILDPSGDRSKGPSFGYLPDLLYQLESRPDATLQSDEWRPRIESILRDLAEGKLSLSTKSDG